MWSFFEYLAIFCSFPPLGQEAKKMPRSKRATNIPQRQAGLAYTPVKRLRGTSWLTIKELEQLSAGHCSNYGWELTSNVRVESPHPNQYRIVIHKIERKSNRRGMKVRSKIYHDVVSAENKIYSFWKFHESKLAQAKLKIWEETYDLSHKEKPTRPVKVYKQRSARFTSNLTTLNKLQIQSCNPNNFMAGPRYILCKEVEVILARKIQRYVRKRDIERAR